MQLPEILEHKLSSASWLPSSHFEPRTTPDLPELVVLHCVSLPEGEFGTGVPARLFTGQLDSAEHPSFADLKGLRVAPHLFIDRTGQTTQFVRFDQQAWHAGLSIWRGRAGCNDFSIGIELEGCVDQGFEDAQYESLKVALLALLLAYPSLSVAHVAGHADLAPGRKFDPGPLFDWSRLLREVHAMLREALSVQATYADEAIIRNA